MRILHLVHLALAFAMFSDCAAAFFALESDSPCSLIKHIAIVSRNEEIVWSPILNPYWVIPRSAYSLTDTPFYLVFHCASCGVFPLSATSSSYKWIVNTTRDLGSFSMLRVYDFSS